MQEFFNALRVSRDDLLAIGFDASNLSDFEMENVAHDLGSNEYIMNGFWDILRLIAEEMELQEIVPVPLDGMEDEGWEG